jgi:hypothetical protein
MNEDSFLDSYMESYIGGWTGDEDRYYAEDEAEDGYLDDDSYEDTEEYWEEEDRAYDRRCREIDGEFDHDDF